MFSDDDNNFEGRPNRKVSGTVSYQNMLSNAKKEEPIHSKNSLDVRSQRGGQHYSQSSFAKNKNIKKKNFMATEARHSEAGDQSNIDEVDFESIIQTKMIDRSGVKREESRGNKSMQKLEYDEDNHEISPSWFNIQNQRYDLEEEN